MKKKIIPLIVTGILILNSITITGCASWERGMKDLHSDFSGGLDRTVKVYDYYGNELATYEGSIDIQEDSSGKIKFDINNKKRVIIYNAIVIAEEK